MKFIEKLDAEKTLELNDVYFKRQFSKYLDELQVGESIKIYEESALNLRTTVIYHAGNLPDKKFTVREIPEEENMFLVIRVQ